MKIAVLTTQTLHHTYFIRELNKVFPVTMAVVERKVYKSPFDTHHPFEDQREVYERKVFFGGKDALISDFVQVKEVESVNDEESLKYLEDLNPEVMIVFGTGKISGKVINLCPAGIVNLHGGDPEEYRGLDTHLWAIYHQDFSGLITTIHRVNPKLDDGEIILMKSIPLKKGMDIYELRRYNTDVCVDLTLGALAMFEKLGHFVSRPQRKVGRYYSFMPPVLKEICLDNFKRHLETIT